MKIIEIEALSNGAHRNQTGGAAVPEGWAVIPEGMTLDNFPFGTVTAAEIGGVMTLTEWIPGEIPEPDPTPAPTADQRYAPGDYLTIDGTLYRVILPILPGSRITPGTNVEETTIENEITRISKEETT